MSVRDWIESRVPGGLASPMGTLLDVAYNIEFGLETTRQSALNLVYLLASSRASTASRSSAFGRDLPHPGRQRPLPRAWRRRFPPAPSASAGGSAASHTARGTWPLASTAVPTSSPITFCSPSRSPSCARWTTARPASTTSSGPRSRSWDTAPMRSSRFSFAADPGEHPTIGNSTGQVVTDLAFQNTWEVSRSQPGTKVSSSTTRAATPVRRSTIPARQASPPRRTAFSPSSSACSRGSATVDRARHALRTCDRAAPARLLRLLPRRSVHPVRRHRGRARRHLPFRRRALLHRLPGLEGARGGRGCPRREGDAARSDARRCSWRSPTSCRRSGGAGWCAPSTVAGAPGQPASVLKERAGRDQAEARAVQTSV